jgi:hypothetical protein
MVVDAGHQSRSSGLLRVKASQVRVFQSDIKTRWVVHVAPSQRLRQSQVEGGRIDATGCIGLFYPTFVVFNVLGTRDIVVI